MAHENSRPKPILNAHEAANQTVCHDTQQLLNRLWVLGLSHRTATVEVRGQLSMASADRLRALQHLHSLPGVAECMVLNTCNRTEVYAVLEDGDSASLLSGLAEWFGLSVSALHPYFYQYQGTDSVKHLFRVASGLDSAVIGETQILGQLKRAFSQARESGCAGPLLSRLNEHAWGMAKRVRTDTGIGRCPVSLAGTAVSQITQLMDCHANVSTLVIGAGENAELVVRHLASRHVGQVTVANRDVERAQTLAARFGATAIGLGELANAVAGADIIISTTGAPAPVLSAGMVRGARDRRGDKPQLLLDLAVPADIETAAGEIPGVELRSADDLGRLARANMRSRKSAVHQAESILDHGVQSYERWLRTRSVVPTIRKLRENADAHRRVALGRAQRQLARGIPAEEVLDSLSRHLTNRLLHAPMDALHGAAARQTQQTAILAIRQTFGLEDDADNKNSELND